MASKFEDFLGEDTYRPPTNANIFGTCKSAPPPPPPLTKKPSHGPDRKGANIKWNGSYLASTIQF